MADRLQIPGPLLLVGAGKMGGAMLDGWLSLGLDPKSAYVVDPQPSEDMVASLETSGVALNPTDMPTPAVIILAVKPQMADAVLPTLGQYINRTLVISVMAGKTLASLGARLPAGTAIIRTMPNTPAAVGRSMTVLVANDKVVPSQREIADRLMSAIGQVAWLDDESLMDAVTAVSGSGPAYVFLLAETLTYAGLRAGLSADMAATLAQATVAGAGELLHRSDLPPAVLRKNVTSPGGTTAAALEVLMGEGGMEALMIKAVEAAAKRSRELGT